MSASASSIPASILNNVLGAAVAQLVRAAVDAQADLSARGIRQTLETEFACDLRARKDVIARAIQATLAEEARDDEPISRDPNGASPDAKRRKAPELRRVNVELPKPRLSSARIARYQLHAAEDAHVCDESDARAATNAFFANYKRVLSGQRPFECDVSCAPRHDVGARKRTPSDERTHAGDEFENQSTNRSRAFEHQRAHSGERPYACDECEFRCGTRSGLAAHTRTHTGERPYACDLCEYRCVRRRSLTVHMRRHSGERPYACDECDYRCVQSSALDSHRRTHTGERPHACDQCDFRSAQSHNLKDHKRRMHSAE